MALTSTCNFMERFFRALSFLMKKYESGEETPAPDEGIHKTEECILYYVSTVSKLLRFGDKLTGGNLMAFEFNMVKGLVVLNHLAKYSS